ncbi:MAG: hypothetical protein VX180_06995 [Pseudomonadota bacterium]|nr:hypothetical protein [Pseudomonadota bacterium]MEC8003646.1 hypothetical protein [Pseudomonadota bacterium]MEC8166900.1 hypothetical protein [Pseudomonadota bacterium]MEC8438524.1 hypothetical protein [Pseudomonadota bacterium]
MAVTRSTPRQQLDDKLANGLHTRRRQHFFLAGMLQPSLTWCALGLTYLLVKTPRTDDAVWLSGILALYALQITTVWYQSESLSTR